MADKQVLIGVEVHGKEHNSAKFAARDVWKSEQWEAELARGEGPYRMGPPLEVWTRGNVENVNGEVEWKGCVKKQVKLLLDAFEVGKSYLKTKKIVGRQNKAGRVAL